MSVIANSNKEILWEVLNGLIQENNFHLPKKNDFQIFFENRCLLYHKKRFDFDGLNTINKQIVADCFEYLSRKSHDNSLVMFREYKNLGNKNIVKNLEVGKRYQEHESNFKKMMKVERPGDINFSEDVDRPISDMDGKLNEMLKQRNNELSNITNNYDKDDIRWLSTGDVPKLKIESNNNLELEVEEISNKKLKRVKFESKIIDNVKNYEMGKDIASKVIKEELHRESVLENDIVNNMQKDYQEPTDIMVKQFEMMNQNINQEISGEKEKFVNKMKIIKDIENKEDSEKNKNKKENEDINLSSIFKNMKLKSKDSDIISANTEEKVNLEKRIDKLEQYMIDIIRNQQMILQKIEKNKSIISQNVHVNDIKEITNKNDEVDVTEPI